MVSESSARKAARRGAKICTGFHPLRKVREIFDAYRDEAEKAGLKAGPDDLCLRRVVTMLESDRDTEATMARQVQEFRKFLVVDPRLDTPERPALLDTSTAHTFSIGDEEFIAGTPAAVAENIIQQCRSIGAGNFAAIFGRAIPLIVDKCDANVRNRSARNAVRVAITARGYESENALSPDGFLRSNADSLLARYTRLPTAW